MTIGSRNFLQCDSCGYQETTAWTLNGGWNFPSLSSFTISAAGRAGWKLLRATKAHPRRDFCPACVKLGRVS